MPQYFSFMNKVNWKIFCVGGLLSSPDVHQGHLHLILLFSSPFSLFTDSFIVKAIKYLVCDFVHTNVCCSLFLSLSFLFRVLSVKTEREWSTCSLGSKLTHNSISSTPPMNRYFFGPGGQFGRLFKEIEREDERKSEGALSSSNNYNSQLEWHLDFLVYVISSQKKMNI